MSKKDDPAPAAAPPPAEKPAAPAVAPGYVRVKIWTDGVFSSLGAHAKGVVVDVPEADAEILIAGEHAQKC